MIFENRGGEAAPTQATVRAFKPLEQTKLTGCRLRMTLSLREAAHDAERILRMLADPT
jgi:hypothetical protein